MWIRGVVSTGKLLRMWFMDDIEQRINKLITKVENLTEEINKLINIEKENDKKILK